MAYMTIGSLLCARYYVKHLTYVIYLQFQMCEVGDHHHFTEVAGKTNYNWAVVIFTVAVGFVEAVQPPLLSAQPPHFRLFYKRPSLPVLLGSAHLVFLTGVPCSGAECKE